MPNRACTTADTEDTKATIVTKWLAIWHNGVNVLTETDQQRAARTGLSSNDMADLAARQVQKTYNRVTIDSIRAKILRAEYIHPEIAPHMTICVVEMENGFFLVGKSVPADPANFDPELGAKFAAEDAERHAWVLEGYLLRETMHKHAGIDDWPDSGGKQQARSDETVRSAAGTAGQPAGAKTTTENPVG